VFGLLAGIVTLPFSKTVLRQVVGIVGDVKQRNLIEATTPTVYFYTRESSEPRLALMPTPLAAMSTRFMHPPVGVLAHRQPREK
jgi:hypothetical protein